MLLNKVIIFLIILIFLLNCGKENNTYVNYSYIGEGNIIKVEHYPRSFLKDARTIIYTRQGGVFNVFGIVNIPNTNYVYIYKGNFGLCEIYTNKNKFTQRR